MRSSDLVRLEAARGLLMEHGVAAHVVGLDVAMLHFPPNASARLLVHRSDLDRSIEVLQSPPASGEGEEA
jgi:hypothetical protein